MSSDKTTTYTTETAPDGTEIITEIDTTITEVAADGTETVSEITTTQGDDPSDIESSIVITETAPDGTESVVEFTTDATGQTSLVEADETLFEEIVEAVLDIEIGEDASGASMPVEATSAGAEIYVAEIAEDDSGIETGDVAVIDGSGEFAPDVLPVEMTGAPIIAAASPDATFGFASPVVSETATTTTADTAFEPSSDTTDPETVAAEAHAQAATDAQSQADDFIAEGDYAAAAQAREVAETEAWEAGDDTMLSAYDASYLTVAAEKQDTAEAYNAQQAEYAQQGNYEAAREAADNSAYATSEADYLAGGADHTGQADAEKYNMDWAVYQEKQADHQADNAAAYAADGDFDNAERAAASAVEYQASADHYGDLGEHGGDIAVYDPSAEVASGGTYESSFDSTVAPVDTGYDAGVVDTSGSSGYDTGTDDV